MTGSQTKIPTATDDKSQILLLLEQIIDAFNAKDIELLLSMHSDDIILMDPGMATISGKETILKMFSEFKSRDLSIQLSYVIEEVEVDQQLAFARGRVKKLSSTSTTGVKTDEYRFLCLFRKQADGKWVRTRVIANSEK